VFSADFYSSDEIVLQTYKPLMISPDIMKYQLMDELNAQPTVASSGREEIYIESLLTKKCIYVKKGYRLAVSYSSRLPSIKYSFSSSTGLFRSLGGSPGSLAVGDVISFDPVMLPHRFSLSAHVFTGDANATSIGCVSGLVIPSGIKSTLTTTTQSVTGRPGAIGATGPSGQPGETGGTGLPGTPGIIGPAGGTGSTGFTGPVGQSGYTGAIGSPGQGGSMGSDGLQGVVGSVGMQGATGNTGARGYPGLNMALPFSARSHSKSHDSFLTVSNVLQLDVLSEYWSRDDAIISVFIWLAVFSFVLFCLLLFVSALACVFRSAFSMVNDSNRKL